MTARLVIATDGTTSQYQANFNADLQTLFNAYMDRFDYTTGTITLTEHVNATETRYALASGPGGLVNLATYVDRGTGPHDILENSTVQGILTGGSSGPMTGELYLFDPYLHNVYQPGGVWAADIPRAITHELDHIFGNDFSVYDRTTHKVGPQETIYDTHVQFDAQGNGFFNGPNAQAVYGGLVPLDQSIDHPYFALGANGVTSVMNYNQSGWAYSLTNLDIAIAKDNGVPVLTDNERDEHFWTRAVDVLFHHQVSAPAVEAWAKILEANGGDLSGTADQFLNLLGIHSMTGQQLVDAANSDAERQALSADPNKSYSHTVEEEITRIYQMATGQNINPWDYEHALNSVLASPINALTLQTQVAMPFLASQASADNFSQDVDHLAAVNRVMASAGIYKWDFYPDACKTAIMTMPLPELIVALADNNTCIAHQAFYSASWHGPQPGMLPEIAGNLPHQTGV